MNKKEKYLDQFLYHDNDDDDFAISEYIEESAPLIGFVVHSFNSLEQSLNKLICEIISDRSDEFGLIIIHNLTYSQKVDLFDRFSLSFQNDFGKKISSYTSLIKKLKESSTLRNAVVHADWESMDKDGFAFLKVKFSKTGFKQEYLQFTSESLEKIIETIQETENLLYKFWEERMDIFRTS